MFIHGVSLSHYSNTRDFIREVRLLPKSQQLNLGLSLFRNIEFQSGGKSAGPELTVVIFVSSSNDRLLKHL